MWSQCSGIQTIVNCWFSSRDSCLVSLLALHKFWWRSQPLCSKHWPCVSSVRSWDPRIFHKFPFPLERQRASECLDDFSSVFCTRIVWEASVHSVCDFSRTKILLPQRALIPVVCWPVCYFFIKISSFVQSIRVCSTILFLCHWSQLSMKEICLLCHQLFIIFIYVLLIIMVVM